MLHYIIAATLPLTIFAQNLNPIPCVVTSVSSTSVCDFNLTLSSSMSAVITDTSCVDPNSVSTTSATIGISFTSNWSYPVTYMCRGVKKWVSRTAAMKLNTIDGYSRPIVTFNGQYPGPIIKLTNSSSTSQARINVMNMNSLESTSVSFNGITFENAPFMSGAPSISQCPISPSQKFSYRFTMNPVGTRSYESLQGGQGSDGASGVAVVEDSTSTTGIVVEVADWYPYEFSTLVKAAPYDWEPLKKTVAGSQTGGFYSSYSNYQATSFYTDFAQIGMIPWWSILVGGKGFTNSNNYGPVRMYQTTQTSGNVKFHFVHTGIEKPINIDIPGHNLTAIAKDGYKIFPVEVDTLWILPGESWDVEVKLNAGGNFPIRARGPNTVAVQTLNRANSPWSFGVFNYGTGISPDYPNSTFLNAQSGSRNLNCPFNTYVQTTRTCIFQGTLKSPTDINGTALEAKINKSDVTYLLTMGAQRGKYNINGYRMPSFIQAPIQLNGQLTNNTRCPGTYCTTFATDNETNPTCECRHQIDIEKGKVVTLILTNFGPAIDTTVTAVGRPVGKPRVTGYTQTFTIQGHSFYLLHQEKYPETCGTGAQSALDLTTFILRYCPTLAGNSYSFPDDIDCTRVGTIAVGDCLNPLIRNLTRIEQRFNLLNPPKMNTISIPLGHFVAIRFVADNPGVWLARSTNKLAYAKGQAMVFNVSLPQSNQRVSIPENMPQCNPFVNNTLNYAIERIVAPTVAPVFVQEPCAQLIQFNARWLIFGILNGILVGFCFWWTCYMFYWAPEYSMSKKKSKTPGRTAGGVRATDEETSGFTQG